MKKLYMVNVYEGNELIDTRNDVVDVITVCSQITGETYTDLELKGNRTHRYKQPQYRVEILK